MSPRRAPLKGPVQVNWRAGLRADPLPWLLEEDEPSIRFYALRDLLERPVDDSALLWAGAAIPSSPTGQAILAALPPAGRWGRTGGGYFPAFRGAIWTLIVLAELGAPGAHPAIETACQRMLDHTLNENGDFTPFHLFGRAVPSPVPALCLPGNGLFFLLRFGLGDDPRVQRAVRRLAERSLASGWKCLANHNNPCWWAAIKTLKAFAELPERTGVVAEATGRAVDLLLSHPYWDAAHPAARDPNWARFGFPLFYQSDLLEMAEALARVELARDPRTKDVVALIAGKQGPDGTWPLERSFNGQMQADIEAPGQPSKWITLRALRVLKAMIS